MLGKEYENVKITPSLRGEDYKNAHIQYNLLGKCSMKNDYLIFVVNLDETNLPKHYVLKMDNNSFELFSHLCITKYKLYNLFDIQNAPNSVINMNCHFFEIFLCKVLKAKYSDNKVILSEIEKIQKRAKEYVDNFAETKEKETKEIKQACQNELFRDM